MVGSEQPAAPRSYGSGGAETQRTSTRDEPEEPRAATRERRPRRALLGGALALTAAVAGLRRAHVAAPTFLRSSPSHPHGWHSNYTIVVSNEYSRLYGQPGRGYPFLTEGSVVEPHAETLLRVLWTGGSKGQTSVSELRWEVEQDTNTLAFGKQVESHVAAVDASALLGGADGDSVGGELMMVFKNVGTYRVRVLVVDDLKPTEILEKSFYSRYVRRSIRSLTTVDRDTYLDAFKLMLTMGKDEGMHRYGSAYRSVDYFVGVHLERAGAREVDKMHDGMGFLTQHVALTNEFELSLQTISPKLSVPYWDYTYDAEVVRRNQGDLPMLWAQDVWRDDWFGNATASRRHTVTTGRFAYQQITKVGPQSVITHNAYGYMRAPWNVNRSPYLTRVHKFCDATFDAGQEKGASTSLQRGCSRSNSQKKSIYALSSPREMIARPKMSQNEWKPTEIRAS